MSEHFFLNSAWPIQKTSEQLRNSHFVKQFLIIGKVAFLLKILQCLSNDYACTFHAQKYVKQKRIQI